MFGFEGAPLSKFAAAWTQFGYMDSWVVLGESHWEELMQKVVGEEGGGGVVVFNNA